MGHHTLDVLRLGLWASLTGGWFHDPNQSIFCNTFHLYLWLLLLTVPLTLHLTLPPSFLVWSIYCCVVFVVFALIKLGNLQLHHMFDTCEVIEEEVDKSDKSTTNSEDADRRDKGEFIEMTTMNHMNQSQESSLTPPVRCSSRNSVANAVSGLSPIQMEKASDRKCQDGESVSEENDHKDTTENTEGPSVITEIAEVYSHTAAGQVASSMCIPANCKSYGDLPGNDDLSDGEVKPALVSQKSNGEIDIGSIPKREDSDSDLSPEHKIRPRRERRAMRRTKSALESPSTNIFPGLGIDRLSNRARLSLPLRQRPSIIVDRQSNIFHPLHDNEDVYERSGSSKSQICDFVDTIIDVDPLDTTLVSIDHTPHTFVTDDGTSGSLSNASGEVNASTEGVPRSPDRAWADGSIQSSEIFHTPQSSISDGSEPSAGEVWQAESPMNQVNSRVDSEDATSGSNQTLTESCTVTREVKKPKKKRTKPISYVSGDDSCSTPSQSHQSSIVGLDWLFSTDSDSLTSDSCSLHDEFYSSSTLTNEEGDEMFDTSPDQPVQYELIEEQETTSAATSSTSADELEVLKRQGAIPKQYQRHSQRGEHTAQKGEHTAQKGEHTAQRSEHTAQRSEHTPQRGEHTTQRSEHTAQRDEHTSQRGEHTSQRGEHTTPRDKYTTEGRATSPGSTDLSDPEDFRRKIIEILNDPNDYPEQLRKLKAALHAKNKRESNNVDQTNPVHHREQAGVKGILWFSIRYATVPIMRFLVITLVRSFLNKSASPASKGQSDVTACGRPSGSEDIDARSSDSKSEVSALLPTSGSNASSRDETRPRRRRHRRSGRLASRRPRRNLGFSEAANGQGHLAYSHDDTTNGAVHWFQDEAGNWFNYTFGDNTTGVAQGMLDDPWSEMKPDKWSSSSSMGSGSTVIVDSPHTVDDPHIDTMLPHIDLPSSVAGLSQRIHLHTMLENARNRTAQLDSSSDSEITHNNTTIDDRPKHFYKFRIFPKKYIKIRFDRLALLALLDRHISLFENLLAVIMAVGVGALGALVLASNFYQDFWIFLFCFIMAGSHYSILKSVQPDAASPMHGYNHLISFSRPFYFCLCCGLLVLLDYASRNVHGTTYYIYGMPFTAVPTLVSIRYIVKVFILCFPLIFTIGLLPQINTFMMYALEQLDMHIFGGNATTSLIAALHSVTRSLVAIILLYGLCYVPLQKSDSSQNVVFSVFSGLIVCISYHLSRGASDPSVLWSLIKDAVIRSKPDGDDEKDGSNDLEELIDPLPDKLKKCVSQRLQSDLLVSVFILILVFAVHVSTVFTSPVLQPMLSDVLYFFAASLGFIIHYIIPQLRKEMPWLCYAHPIFTSYERNYFEVKGPAKVMWFEKMYVWLRFFERNVMMPVVFLCAITVSAPKINTKFGPFLGPVIVVVCGLKSLRFAFSDTPKQHLILAFTVLFFKYDYRTATETFLIDYFFISILFCKFLDLLLKIQFILTYIAPWQITWGAVFHAFAQPFSVPHSAMLFLQAFLSAFFSTPLQPVLGSAIFFTSYLRPVKFWERDYNTKRVDSSNTRLASQLDRTPGADDNNLNSIFYEHLTRSLQHSLCGDLMLGRWGNTAEGDCFIMASDSLNALVHVIETGNGLVTFQLRGLEFRGTYCQQREVEEITEGVEGNEGFCCFEPGHLPHFLSLNAAFNQRWLAWEVVVTKYVLEGYSISDNSAASMLQVFDLRKVLITYYIKIIIYYSIRSPRLEEWLQNSTINDALQPTLAKNYVDLDPTFNMHVDDDFDQVLSGISRNSFCRVYLEWIQYCASRREQHVDNNKDSALVSLVYGLSLLGRRALGTASHNSASASVDFFLFGLHALFKGDFRITSPRDEWVFADMEMLRRVVAPAIRMSLKLHQDHFTSPDEYDDHQMLYDAITSHEQTLVISHEADPAWRNAVLSNTPSLLALRHLFDEGSDEYKIIMLNKRYLTFRIVKVNRECVRGLWAGQQQELIFLRNRNPERGSIQNAKQALRNMINSSCDQPIGYPIYVSPLTTSYSSSNEQLASIIGGEFIIANVKNAFKNFWHRIRGQCGASCTGSSVSYPEELTYTIGCTPATAAATLGSTRSTVSSTPAHQTDIALQNLGNRGSLISTTSSASKPTALATITGLISDSNASKETLPQRVKVVDTSQVYDTVNLGRRIDVQWPNEEWRQRGGKNVWNSWRPSKEQQGTIVHRWVPCHRERGRRSHVDRTIVLVEVDTKDNKYYVPIAESGVQDLGVDV